MKKQFLLAGILLLTAVCLCTFSNNNAKACVKTAEACQLINKTSIKNIDPVYVEDVDASFDMFMNPFTQL